MEYRNTQIPISKATKLVHLVLLLRCFCFHSFAASAAAAGAVAALLALISVCCALLLAWHSLAFCAICALYFSPFSVVPHTHTHTQRDLHSPIESWPHIIPTKLKYFIFQFPVPVPFPVFNSTCNGRSITVFLLYIWHFNQSTWNKFRISSGTKTKKEIKETNTVRQ